MTLSFACRFLGVVLLLVAGMGCKPPQARPFPTVRICAAANFAAPMQVLTADFEKATGHHTLLSFGSTGQLHTQIKAGAPFDVLLAADDRTPAQLEADGFAMAGSRFAYAIGRLALWSPKEGVVDGQGDILRQGGFKHLAVADPKLAPYGRAAEETLKKMGLFDALKPAFVTGKNIAQTHQFAASGNAELGFVACSQVIRNGAPTGGSAWIVPADLHPPIRQEAVLLTAGKDNPVAREFLAFLKTEKARALIRAHGYDLPGAEAAR